MSHYLETNRAAFSRPAWHKLGVILEPSDTRSVVEFQRAARMDYEVHKQPVYALTDSGFREIPNQFHLVRTDDERVVSPSTVSSRYTPLQPSRLFEVAKPFVDEGWASPDAAFTLYDGQSEVVSLRLDLQDQIPGDDSRWVHYMILQNHHGRGALRGKITSIRVVCHNTATAAFGSGADWSLRHTASVDARLDDAMARWEKLRATMQDCAERLAPLTQRVLGISELDSALRAITNSDPTGTPKPDYGKLYRYTFESPGVSGKGTAYDVLQAVTYYNSHDGTTRGRNDASRAQNRVASMLMGARAAREKAAQNLLLSYV